jgi:hypothetical protein
MEILKKINEAAPARSVQRMEVQRLSITDSLVRMEGFVGSAKDSENLRLSLMSLAEKGQIRSIPNMISLPPGKVGFGFEFDVDRNVKMAKGALKTGSKTE